MNIPNYKNQQVLATALGVWTGEPLHVTALSLSRHAFRLSDCPEIWERYGYLRTLERHHSLAACLAACLAARREALAARALQKGEADDDLMVCSFCGQDEAKVERMIRGPQQLHDAWMSVQAAGAEATGHPFTLRVPVNICDQCVALCVEVLNEKGGAAATGAAQKPQGESS